MSRRPRPRTPSRARRPEPGPLLGQILELDVGGPAHGGSCVARVPADHLPADYVPADHVPADHDAVAHGGASGGRAVFVRHALPGERVRAVVTQDRGGAYCFADAVEVLRASADRVEPPCPHAGPGRCGGCDWQHASADAQRELKAQVVREQFVRLARVDVDGLLAGVEALPGGLLGWRTRNVYAVSWDGRELGLRRHDSHEIEPVAHCPLGVDGVADVPAPDLPPRDGGTGRDGRPGQDGGVGDLVAVELARGTADGEAAGPVSLLTHRPGPGRQARGRRPPDRVRVVDGPATLHHRVLGRDLEVSAEGFWQVHPAAAETFARALLQLLAPQPGERVLDLYAGAGALTAALAEQVGPTGSVQGVESSRLAVHDAGRNLDAMPWAEVRHGRVEAIELAGAVDLVVLDPPRAGAGRAVLTALLALRPRAIGYVSCDPASLARDVGVALEAGWRLTALRAFDAFPMTHHVECVARLEPPEAQPVGSAP